MSALTSQFLFKYFVLPLYRFKCYVTNSSWDYIPVLCATIVSCSRYGMKYGNNMGYFVAFLNILACRIVFLMRMFSAVNTKFD